MVDITSLINLHPFYSLIVISIGVTLISTLAQKFLTDQEVLKHLKARQKEIQKELKGCKDEHLLKELNAELIGISGTMFKASMKPMAATIIPFLLLFWWLKGVYTGLVSHWIWYYLGFSMASSIILRKVLKVH